MSRRYLMATLLLFETFVDLIRSGAHIEQFKHKIHTFDCQVANELLIVQERDEGLREGPPSCSGQAVKLPGQSDQATPP
jgi:hypothetical protein